ncbi:hypothetical protein N7489_006406 [Penicillium chrysogenum]|uniref:uncharacterized protein n=1 Tax=Penicillium chrysogenum TaxID=5076 RepID=UPI0024DF2984|nr:uncharacterized protein N7489_006406 [Penicillium chrysogenum]KAJ5236315.1 hypothetical protein N7489_006406 [Penicillium chrysogenum]
MLHSRLRPLPPPPLSQHAQRRRRGINRGPLWGILTHLFLDDAPSFHGDPGQHLLYSSPRYGDLSIMVPSYPILSEKSSEEIAAGQAKPDGSVNQVDEGRKLFAHFLWGAAMVVARHQAKQRQKPEKKPGAVEYQGRECAALPSVICSLAGASKVVATGHPLSPALSGAIAFNIEHNLAERAPTADREISMHPHEWGVLDDSFSAANKGVFTRTVAADCFWMRLQHENLARTMQWFLSPGGKVFVVEKIYERDLVAGLEDGGEIRREWLPVREGEGTENQKRWCVIAVLKRKGE